MNHVGRVRGGILDEKAQNLLETSGQKNQSIGKRTHFFVKDLNKCK